MSSRAMSRGRALDPAILGAYDIRGLVGETLTGADMEAIGRGFATIAQARTQACAQGGRPPLICVGRDGRLSSASLEAHLVAGLAGAGADVVRVGLGPTPMLYFAVHAQGGDGGMMVTGSHNPPAYNGVKMVLGGRPFYGDDIAALARVVADGGFAEGSGRATEADLAPPYVARLLHEAGERPVHGSVGCRQRRRRCGAPRRSQAVFRGATSCSMPQSTGPFPPTTRTPRCPRP